MSFSKNTNNGNGPTTNVYTPIYFKSEFNNGVAFSVSYFNKMMVLSIIPKLPDGSFDKKHGLSVYVSYSNAKILYDLITKFKQDESIHNVCIETNTGLFMVSDGAEFNSSTTCFAITSIAQDGSKNSIVYATKSDMHKGGINYSEGNYTKYIDPNFELDTLHNTLLQYYNASSYAIAASIQDSYAYKYAGVRDRVYAIAEKMGVQPQYASNNNNNGNYVNYQNNQNNSYQQQQQAPQSNSTEMQGAPKGYESTTFDDIVNSMTQ